MNDWFIVDKSIEPEDDENEGLIKIPLICIKTFLLYVSSNYYIRLGENISSVYLNKRIPKRKVEAILPNDVNFRRELLSVYQDMGYVSPFLEGSYRHYELASFLVDDDGVNKQHRLHVGEIISISEGNSESFAILRSIFSHERNNQRFAFIIINRFEITNQTKLECPVYRLQDRRTIHPISAVNTNDTAHFVHYCNNECNGSHEFGNGLYIRNMYFFKAA